MCPCNSDSVVFPRKVTNTLRPVIWELHFKSSSTMTWSPAPSKTYTPHSSGFSSRYPTVGILFTVIVTSRLLERAAELKLRSITTQILLVVLQSLLSIQSIQFLIIFYVNKLKTIEQAQTYKRSRLNAHHRNWQLFSWQPATRGQWSNQSQHTCHRCRQMPDQDGWTAMVCLLDSAYTGPFRSTHHLQHMTALEIEK